MTSPTFKLIPFPTDQQLTDQQPTNITPRPIRPANHLDEEINAMRGAMRLITSLLDECKDLGKLAFHAATVARLSDSIVRALLAAQKLHVADQETAELRAEIERIFRELGWSKHP